MLFLLMIFVIDVVVFDGNFVVEDDFAIVGIGDVVVILPSHHRRLCRYK